MSDVADAPLEGGRHARTGWRAEAVLTLERVEREIDGLVVRGLSACDADDIRSLEHAAASFDGAGAGHVAGRIHDVVARHKRADPGAARALLQLQTSLRVFERVLTLEAIAELLTPPPVLEEDGSTTTMTSTATTAATAATATTTTASTPLSAADGKKLLPVLEDLCGAVEDLVASGLVTASASTKHKLEVSFKEASRLKLGRLAASLRYVMEEIQRYLDGVTTFSGKRFALFLNRSWVLGRALAQAIVEQNEPSLQRLLLSQAPEPLAALRVVTLGVRKRVPLGTGIVAFDFHLRVVDDAGPLRRGAPLVWSHVVARKDGDIAAEALLHLDVKPQGFKPIALAGHTVFAVDAAAVVADGRGGGRLLLGPNTRVRAVDDPPPPWTSLCGFDAAAIVDRLRAWQTSPLDLEVELACEVALPIEALAPSSASSADASTAGDAEKTGEGPERLTLTGGGFAFQLSLPRTEESTELSAALKLLSSSSSSSSSSSAVPSLFGVLHVDRCRLMFHPLALLDGARSAPQQLMLSTSKVDLKALTRSLF